MIIRYSQADYLSIRWIADYPGYDAARYPLTAEISNPATDIVSDDDGKNYFATDVDDGDAIIIIAPRMRDSMNMVKIGQNYETANININNFVPSEIVWYLDQFYNTKPFKKPDTEYFSLDDWRYAIWMMFYPVIQSVDDPAVSLMVAGLEV